LFGLTSILAVLHNATMPQVQKHPFKTGKSTALPGFTSQSLTIFIAFGIVLLAAVGVAIYFYLQYQKTQDQLTRSTQSNEQAALIGEVGKLIVLPSGEQPTIASVSDVNRLKGQPFFVHARNGDKVLIYTKAQEAILYDPVANKIVEVGPISMTQVTPTPKGPTPTPAQVRVAIYNGTPTSGLANKIGTDLTQKMPNATIVAKADAKELYSSTLVVDLTGKNQASASTLAEILGAKLGSLPKAETKPQNADLLIILGK
jgi:hypothetical protein